MKNFAASLQGLLLPTERHKTLRVLVNTEPMVGAKLPQAQKQQWFLSGSDWDERKVQAQRLTLLHQDPVTTPTTDGVLVIDETGDRKDGHHTAHVGRQYLANLRKIDNGVVSEGWWRLFRRDALAGQSFANPKEIEQATRVATIQLNLRAKPWIWGRLPKTPRRRLFCYRI